MLLQFAAPTKVEFAIQIGIQEALGFFTVHLVTPYGELLQIPRAGAGGPGLVGTLPYPRAPSVLKTRGNARRPGGCVTPRINPRFQGYQHALRPDYRFYPCPSGTDLSILWSPFGHCRRGLFRSSVLHASTFLPSFARRALPRFFALTKALSPFGYGSSDPLPVMNAVPFPNSDP